MMYPGSKRRLVKHILPIMLAVRKPAQWWIEPFCGGCNMLEHVPEPRLGADSHGPLMDIWQAVSKGWMPSGESISRERYYEIKKNPERFDPAFAAHVAFTSSFGGRFWATWGADRHRKGDKTSINRAVSAYRNASKQFPKLRGVIFEHCTYDELPLPPCSLIYADPPYAGVAGYQGTTFDSMKFWKWCVEKVQDGHTVFVSEYSCPLGDDLVECVFSTHVRRTMNPHDNSSLVEEKLFRMLDKHK